MSSWRPTTLFEEEVISQQPNHNFIYGDLNDIELRRQNEIERPRIHLEKLEHRRKNKINESNKAAPTGCSLNVIRAVNEMAGLKRMGTETTYEDWDTRENVERETIGMIRACGMGPSVDLPLNEKMTLPTYPVQKDVRILQNGEKKMPIIYDDDYFQITTSRMRTAELIDNFERAGNSLLNDDLKQQKKSDITPLLNNEKEIDNIDEMKSRKLKKFQESYPTLDEQKKMKNKKSNNDENFLSDFSEQDILPTSYPPTNDSTLDDSFYLSCSSNGSGSLNDCSFYTTLTDNLDLTSKSSSSSTETTQKYATILQQTEKLSLNHLSSEIKTQKQIYTPKDVYYIKHRFNNNQNFKK